MRIIKIIFISLIALVAFFFTLGAIFPTFEYTNKVTINAPKEACWEMLTNPTTLHRWINGLETYKLIGGEHLKAGGTYSMVIVDGSEKMEMNQKIEEVNAPSTIRYILTNDVLTSDYTYSLQEMDGKTTLLADYIVTGNSIIWSSVLHLSKGYIAREGQKDLDKFKALVESGK